MYTSLSSSNLTLSTSNWSHMHFGLSTTRILRRLGQILSPEAAQIGHGREGFPYLLEWVS